MIEVLKDLPDNVAGFRATGHVDAEQYKAVLIPEVDRLVQQQDQIRFLLVLNTDMSDFTIGAILQDLGVGLKHFTKWHKMAIVSGSKAIEKFTDFFSYVAPGEAKGFDHSELKEAVAWVSK